MGAVLVHVDDIVEHVHRARQQAEAGHGQKRRKHGVRVVDPAGEHQRPQHEEVLDPLMKRRI